MLSINSCLTFFEYLLDFKTYLYLENRSKRIFYYWVSLIIPILRMQFFAYLNNIIELYSNFFIKVKYLLR